jgi:hypothetical protein
MKLSIVILYVLVSLCLVFSLTALLIVANDHGIFTPHGSLSSPSASPTVSATPTRAINTPTPVIIPKPTLPHTPKPTSTVTLPPNQLTISYSEASREYIGEDKVKVNVTVTASYPSDQILSIRYSEFYVELASFRITIPFGAGTAAPKNSGVLTLGSGHTTESFPLIFEFERTNFNGMDNGTVMYQLYYNGTATVNWADHHWY